MASWGAREGDRARQGVPWGGARWCEALGRGTAVVPRRPDDGASGGCRVVGASEGARFAQGRWLVISWCPRAASLALSWVPQGA